MDHKKGFSLLKNIVQKNSPPTMAEIATLEGRFISNEDSERLFGSNETTRSERNQIIYRLNEISLRESGYSFVELCLKDTSSKDNMNLKESWKNPNSEVKLYGRGNKWAVVVGVNEYDDKMNYGTLKVCVKDAQAISKCLIDSGYSAERIRLLTDETNQLPTKSNILEALKAIANAANEEDLLVFYYSGHGDIDLVENEPYLVAKDGRLMILPDTAVSVDRLKKIMEGSQARAKVIILDACHSGAKIPGKGPKKMSEDFIQRVFDKAEGLAIIASCKQNEFSYEWHKNSQSVFTHYLLDGLNGNADRDGKKFVTVQDINRHVSNGVRLWASQNNVNQTPTFEYTGAGDIILINSYT
jgi:hypothetical protein